MKIGFIFFTLVVVLLTVAAYMAGVDSMKKKYKTRLQLLKYDKKTGEMVMDQFNTAVIDLRSKTISVSNSDLLSRSVMFVGLDEIEE